MKRQARSHDGRPGRKVKTALFVRDIVRVNPDKRPDTREGKKDNPPLVE
jgi:hypothetical protein